MSSTITQWIKSTAVDCGFDLVGVCPAVTPTGFSRFIEWLDAGYAGEMQYLADRRDAYANPASVMTGVKSLVMLGLLYRSRERVSQPEQGSGSVSCYAWSDIDYHDLIHTKLKRLKRKVQQQTPEVTCRGVVDTAPLLEREFAQLAGLGWQGKHTLLINRDVGSWFFLAALLVDCELDYDEPFATDHCGTCRACIDVCPTDAIVQPYVLDARRCISYLTIEQRGPVALELREGLGDWLFGCDLCQDVCPWNNDAALSSTNDFAPSDDSHPLVLCSLFQLSDEEFRSRFRRTPLWRPKRRGLLRNAAIVLGNQADPASVPTLTLGLEDKEPLVRATCAWALGRIGSSEALGKLRKMLPNEPDRLVQQEFAAALASN